MDGHIQYEGEASLARATAPRPPEPGLAHELAEQVEIFADQPSQAMMYSDLYDHLRSGVWSVRRLLPARHPR